MGIPYFSLAPGLNVSRLCLGKWASPTIAHGGNLVLANPGLKRPSTPTGVTCCSGVGPHGNKPIPSWMCWTMTFGEQNSFQQSCELLDEATAAGINFMDAAEM
eukprot:Gb_40069 [translate_table: standard]